MPALYFDNDDEEMSVGNMLSKELNLKCNMVSTQLLAYVEHEHKAPQK